MKKQSVKEIMNNGRVTINVSVLTSLMGVDIDKLIEATKEYQKELNIKGENVRDVEKVITTIAWMDKDSLYTDCWWIADFVRDYCKSHKGETTRFFWVPSYNQVKIREYIEQLNKIEGCWSEYDRYGRIKADYAYEILKDCGLSDEEISSNDTWKTYASAYFSSVNRGTWIGTQKAMAIIKILQCMEANYKLVA